MRALTLVLGLGLAPCFGACLSVDYARTNLFEPLRVDEAEDLATKHAGLADCLTTLGAPNLVFDADPGPVLAWLHGEAVGWVFEGSSALGGDVPLSLTYGRTDDRLEALLVFMDADWRVQRIRRGRASDLDSLRLRPRAVTLEDAPR